MNIEYTTRLEKIESVLTAALPASADLDWLTDSFSTLPDSVRVSHTASLVEPCRELLLRGGKRWRPLLMVLTCEWAGGGERAYGLTPLVEFAHTASLIHDDIEDAAEERRGKPAIHLLYGEDVAVNCAAWLYFHAQSIIDHFPASDGMKLMLHRTYSRELRRLHLGQAMDITWHREARKIPVRSEYEAMVTLKTGTLSHMAGELGMLIAGKDEGVASDFGSICAKIGVGFQVIDDVKNLTTGNPGKKRGDDIVEGKKSLPVILYLEKHPDELEFLASSFAQARLDGIESPVVEQVIDRILTSGAIETARNYGVQMVERSCSAFEKQYPHTAHTELVSGLFKTLLDGLR